MPRGRPPGIITRTHCVDCGVKLDSLNTISKGSNTRASRCYECYAIYRRKLRDENKEKTQEQDRDWNLRSKYGITTKKYDELLEFYQNGCAICRQPCKSGRRLAVDHNHETGEIRGLLCADCNRAMGLLKENESVIWNMLEYLKRTTWKKEVA